MSKSVFHLSVLSLRRRGVLAALLAAVVVPSASGQSEHVPTFQEAKVYYADSTSQFVRPAGIAAGDVIGATSGTPDGFPDVVVVAGATVITANDAQVEPGTAPKLVLFRNQGNEPPPSPLYVWKGLDDPVVLHTFSEGEYPSEVRMADLDGDGDLDVVVTLSVTYDVFERVSTTYGFQIFENSGAGQFTSLFPYLTALPVRGLAVDDLDNDGFNDVIVTVDQFYLPETTESHDIDKTYVIFYNFATESFDFQLDLDLGLPDDSQPGDVAIGHFNRLAVSGLGNSGPFKDLVTANFRERSFSVCANYGNRVIVPQAPQSPPSDPDDCNPDDGWTLFAALAAGQFTAGSNMTDFAGVDSGTVDVLRGHRSGTFNYDCVNATDHYNLEPEPLLETLNHIAAGHLNGGTKLDLATVEHYPSHVTFLLGKGNGKFQYVYDAAYRVDIRMYDEGTETWLGDGPIRVLIADLNQDGFGDLLTSNHSDETISAVLNAMAVIPP